MITEIQIPLAFENMEEATIGAWLVEVGQTVREGDALCELITEKTTFDLPSSVGGVLRRIILPAKSVAAVGEMIALIGAPDDPLPELHDGASAPQPAAAESAPATPPLQNTPATASNGAPIRATPAARRTARERGIKIEEVAAAFPDKVLIEADVKKLAGDA